MILLRPEDALHKTHLFRLLKGILDNPVLSQNVYFKGGTCAAMLGYLDRFSVDLDFDVKDHADKTVLHKNLTQVFRKEDYKVRQKSNNELFYVLEYQSAKGKRNSIKLGLLKKSSIHNEYKAYYLSEIDRFAVCQTIETMFANKLVSIIDRYKKYKLIAGRDLYDIHYFFLQGYKYEKEIVEDRTHTDVTSYFQILKQFIEQKITGTIISQDLNYLLPHEKFQKIRKALKQETLMFIKDEIRRLKEVR